MKIKIEYVVVCMLLISCAEKNHNKAAREISKPIVGTWQLISGTTIEKGDTLVTDYTKNISFIKIINDTHFAFLKHNQNKSSPATYDSGGGKYFLKDSLYTEYLEYCNEREWEGNKFEFTITIKNDTLIQNGIEKVEKAGINRLNIEKYRRLKS